MSAPKPGLSPMSQFQAGCTPGPAATAMGRVGDCTCHAGSRLRLPGALLAALFLAWLPPEAVHAQASGKIVAEWWEAAFLQGVRAGYVRTIVEKFDADGLEHYRSTITFRLSVKRSGDIIELGMDSGTVELPDGKVFGTFMRQQLGKTKTVEIVGTVDGRQLTLTRDKTTPLDPTPWDPEVVGVYKQKTLFRDRAVKPGDTFRFKTFEPTINAVATTHVQVKDLEAVELLAGTRTKQLLRVEAKADKIGTFQLPPYVVWLDESLMPVRAQLEIPGLGKVMLYQATKSYALAPRGATPALDVGIGHYVRLKRAIARPHQTTSAVYRITIKDEDDVATTFAQDERQQVSSVKGNTLELHVAASGEGKATKPPGAEFTQSSYFIASADARVQELARRAVGTAKDPWKKALNIEKWVRTHVKVVNHEALATADHVARTLEGDCTEFAMLTAAMCRAEGIPSKTAMGLIYADVRSGPVFAFHMWTEVWADGRWHALDATLGQGGVGAAHLKISDQSWHEERSLTPLLPVVRVLGKLDIEVLRVEGR